MKIKSYIYGWMALAALMWMLGGCGNLYTGDEAPIIDEEGGGGEGDDSGVDDGFDEALPVMVAFNAPNYTALTRGQGALIPSETDYQDKLKNAIFYVYAFRADTPREGKVYSVLCKDDKETCLIDGSIGTQGADATLSRHGRETTYTSATSFGQWKDEENQPMYSQLSPVTPYDFFVYYIDDLANDTQSSSYRTLQSGSYCALTRSDTDGISFDVAIDGTQDLICAKAKLTADQRTNIEGMSEEERNNVMKYYYSTYTARRNVTPIFSLQHQLAYVKFGLKTGTSASIKDPKQKLIVNSIAIESIYRGTFCVAARDDNALGATFHADGGRKELLLKEKDGTPFLQREITTEGCSIPLDDSYMLLPPSNDAVLRVYASTYIKTQEGPDDTSDEDDVYEEKQYNLVYPLKDLFINTDEQRSRGFLPGWKYTVNITFYGAERIGVEVQVDGWQDGGSIDLDQEDIFQNN